VNELHEDLGRIIDADEEQINQIDSDFLRKQAREIRRMAEVES
jgi:hypothetical protein